MVEGIAEDYELTLTHKTSISVFSVGNVVVASIAKAKESKTGLAFLFNRLTPKNLKDIKGVVPFGKLQKAKEPYSSWAGMEITGTKAPEGLKKVMKIAIKKAEEAAETRKERGKELAKNLKAKKKDEDEEETPKKKSKKSKKVEEDKDEDEEEEDEEETPKKKSKKDKKKSKK
jgi:spore germination cell wall hydrolase CwlJ-like protein